MTALILPFVTFFCNARLTLSATQIGLQVYIESYHTVPKGICRTIVRAMAWTFFASWGMFPVLFLLGPEGFGHLTVYGERT